MRDQARVKNVSKAFLDALRKGERQALEEFYDRYAPEMLGVALRYLAHKEDAEDLVQESFIKIINGLPQFNPLFTGAFEVWMKRIVVNGALNVLREKSKQFHINGSPNMHDHEEADDLTDNEQQSLQLDPQTALNMLAELPEGYRTVMNLYVFENYTHKQIAQALDITENTSKSQLSKARNMMRNKMKHYFNQKQTVENER
ncbi:MAG: sigma-70 family RNA polymerase sigma factor [Bacteroidales bacterium]|nr:sigma-70 family RNA polymerase sigma factor [Bacteroidales bacterium]